MGSFNPSFQEGEIMTIFTKAFWRDALERALWTFAQVFVSIAGVFIPAIVITNQETLETGVSLALQVLPWIALASLGGALFSIIKTIAKAQLEK